MLADFLVGELADPPEQFTVASVDFGFLSDFKQPLGAGIAASMNAVADAGNELVIDQPFLDCLKRDAVEISFFRILRQGIIQHACAVLRRAQVYAARAEDRRGDGTLD